MTVTPPNSPNYVNSNTCRLAPATSSSPVRGRPKFPTAEQAKENIYARYYISGDDSRSPSRTPLIRSSSVPVEDVQSPAPQGLRQGREAFVGGNFQGYLTEEQRTQNLNRRSHSVPARLKNIMR